MREDGHGFGGTIGCKRNALNFLQGTLQKIGCDKIT